MIKNIVFDLGNVVIPNPKLDIAKEFFKNEKDAENFSNFIFKSKYWQMLDLGLITNIDVANEIIKNKDIEVSNSDEIIDFMLNWYTKRNVNKDIIPLKKKLEENGYNIYILSNMGISTFEYFKDRSEFFKNIDGEIISAYEHVKKPDIKIFEILLSRYNLIPNECLLIDDDDTNKTLEVANSIGINGRRVMPNNVEDIYKLLNEYNILF